MSRAHLFRPLRDSEGNLKPTAVVSLFQRGTTTPIEQPIYSSPTGSTTLSNPFAATLGIIDVYLDEPEDIDIFFEVDGLESTISNVAVAPAAEEVVRTLAPLTITNTPASGQILLGTGIAGEAAWGDVPAMTGEALVHHHDGDVAGSTQLGQDALAGISGTALGDMADAGQEGTAVGYDATAGQRGTAVGATTWAAPNSVAVGYGAGANIVGQYWVAIGYNADPQGTGAVVIGYQAAAGEEAVALGPNASAPGLRSVALGAGASAQNEDAVALGSGAVATHARSTVIGKGAASTAADQIVLGSADHTVVVPGRLNATGGDTHLAGTTGRVGYYGAEPIPRPTVSGSAGGNAALSSLLLALEALGLITDDSSP